MVLNGLPRILAHPDSVIHLGNRVVLNSIWKSNALGIGQPCTLVTTKSGAEIMLGADTGISGTTISASASITIGQRVLVGEGCLITDSDHHPVDVWPNSDRRYAVIQTDGVRPVVIGNDVFIGARTIILKGVHIGNGTVIGAGSVVVSSIPEGVVAGGNPCRVIRSLRAPGHAEDETL